MLPRQAAVLRPNPNIPRHQATISNGGGTPRHQYRPLANGNQHPRISIPGQNPAGRIQHQQRMQIRPAQGTAGGEIPPAMVNMGKPDKPWGWTTMDGVIVPYIMRSKERFVSVKMVESKLLSKFPKINMEDMTNVGPIYSYYVTESEAKLLTEINTRCYNHGFGAKSFTTKDLIVSLENFTSFYNRAKKHFESKVGAGAADVAVSTPSSSASNNANAQNVAPPVRIEGGWVQINNTVVPYLFRSGVKFVPLSVIKYAAGLLTDIRMDGHKVPCTEMEYIFLNHCCQSAHINFTFSIKTKLIKMEHVIRMSQSKVNIIELPTQDPFSYAQYQFGGQNPGGAGGEINQHSPQLQGGYQMPIMQPQVQISPQQGHHPHHPQMSPPNMPPQQMPPRNPFIPMRPGMNPAAMHHPGAPHPPPPPPYRPAMGGMQFPPRHQIPTSVSAAMARNMRTPSPSISPRTQAAMAIPNVQARPMRPHSNSNPSTPNSRPSSAQSRNSVTPPTTPQNPAAPVSLPAVAQPPKGSGDIKVFKFEGRNLSCLMRGEGKEPFALLEALVRLYFPQCSLQDFQSALEQFLNVPVQQLLPEEETAFIRFYELNVKSLRSKAIVSFNRFKELYKQLLYIFKNGDSTSPSEDSQDSNFAVQITSGPAPEVIDLDSEANAQTTDIVNNNNPSDVIKPGSQEDTAAEAGQKRKRGGNTAQSTRKPKQFCKRLEDTVAMLRLRQDPVPSESAEGVSSPVESAPSVTVKEDNKTEKEAEADAVMEQAEPNRDEGIMMSIASEKRENRVIEIIPESETAMDTDGDAKYDYAALDKDNEAVAENDLINKDNEIEKDNVNNKKEETQPFTIPLIESKDADEGKMDMSHDKEPDNDKDAETNYKIDETEELVPAAKSDDSKSSDKPSSEQDSTEVPMDHSAPEPESAENIMSTFCVENEPGPPASDIPVEATSTIADTGADNEDVPKAVTKVQNDEASQPQVTKDDVSSHSETDQQAATITKEIVTTSASVSQDAVVGADENNIENDKEDLPISNETTNETKDADTKVVTEATSEAEMDQSEDVQAEDARKDGQANGNTTNETAPKDSTNVATSSTVNANDMTEEINIQPPVSNKDPMIGATTQQETVTDNTETKNNEVHPNELKEDIPETAATEDNTTSPTIVDDVTKQPVVEGAKHVKPPHEDDKDISDANDGTSIEAAVVTDGTDAIPEVALTKDASSENNVTETISPTITADNEKPKGTPDIEQIRQKEMTDNSASPSGVDAQMESLPHVDNKEDAMQVDDNEEGNVTAPADPPVTVQQEISEATKPETVGSEEDNLSTEKKSDDASPGEEELDNATESASDDVEKEVASTSEQELLSESMSMEVDAPEVTKLEDVTNKTMVSDEKDSVLDADQLDKNLDNVAQSDVSFEQQESGGFEIANNTAMDAQTSETTKSNDSDAISENQQDSTSMVMSKAVDSVGESDLIDKPTDTAELDNEDKVAPSPVTDPEPVTMDSTSSNLTSDVTADTTEPKSDSYASAPAKSDA